MKENIEHMYNCFFFRFSLFYFGEKFYLPFCQLKEFISSYR
uniref:Uncharacterized protein n=1 Tax=Anguilla anguilla TaxID=7936 RepID=A0A0E9WLP5_ANGAN